MKPYFWNYGIVIASSTLVLGTSVWAADPTFIIDNQVGQATDDTCQSYVLAIALAFKRDLSIPLTSWRDIRDLELKLR